MRHKRPWLGALLFLLVVAGLGSGALAPRRAWGQTTITVPLGTAARFGLLTGNVLTTDAASGVKVAGAVGAPEFFAHVAGATAIEGSSPGLYAGMLKG